MYLSMILITALGTVIFILDCFTPLGYSVWILYVFPIFFVFSSCLPIVCSACNYSLFIRYCAGFFLFSSGCQSTRSLNQPNTGDRCAVGVWRLLSQRKQAEEAIRESEQRVSEILSSITDCHYTLDKEWCVTRINDHALRYFG